MNRVFALALFALPMFAQRLPETVRPSHYAIALDIDIVGKRFEGSETIDVASSEDVEHLALNSVDLTIHSATIDGETVRVTQNESEQITLHGRVPKGEHEIRLVWSAPLNDTKLQGLYLSKSKRRAYAVTQFEGTYARMMFPSFDEPAFKATFDLSVVVANGDTAISNARVAQDEPDGEGHHRITFATSPKMSTYLLALAVGDFVCTGRGVGTVPVRVCTIPEKLDEARYPLEATEAALRFYQQWYTTHYPFGKLDLVAIPDYEWGGMENTACIFFRESSLLVGASPSASTRQRVAGLVAHEIAHQWFGDLVTAAWWDDIWLNEGFATWMAVKPVANWHPEWPTTEAAAGETQSAIAVDSLDATHAIHASASTPGEIKEMFDGISYEKGAALLRMLETYVGAEAFRNGVNAYLQEHAYGNATSADFAAALARASGKPVDAILRSFILQPGVPLVTFGRRCVGEQGAITLAQSAKGDQRWTIPVCMRVGRAAATSDTRCFVLSATESSFDLPYCPEWIDGNAGALGYYRSAYAPAEAAALAKHARATLTPSERVALLEDTWAGVRAGRASVESFLGVASGLAGETDRAVIGSLASKVLFVRDQLVRKDNRPEFDRWLRGLFTRAVSLVEWTSRAGESDARRELRATLLRTLGATGEPAAVGAARRLVDVALAGKEPSDAALRDAAFDVAAANGDAALYDRLVARLPNAKTTQEHDRLLYALTRFDRPALAARSLELVNTGVVRINDYPGFFGSMLSNAAMRDRTWAYLEERWSDLAPKVVSFGGRGAIPALGTACTQEFRDDVAAFFATHPAPGAERALQQALEQIDVCVKMRATWKAAAH